MSLTALFFSASAAQAQNTKYEIGLRASVLLGTGSPANDIPGFGLAGRLRFNDRWFAGAALERYEYDFERPYEIAGIAQDPDVPVIDATVSSTVLSAFIGQSHGHTEWGFHWFWTAGLGFGFPDVTDVRGPTAAGGMFDVTTDAGSEFHLLGSLEVRYRFNRQWSIGAAARIEHHMMDFKVMDRVSGSTGTVDSQTPKGFHFGVNYHF